VSAYSSSSIDYILTIYVYIGYPHCPLLLQPVFSGPEWDTWTKLVRSSAPEYETTDDATTTASDDLLRVQPEIAALISRLVNTVKSHGDAQEQKLEQVLSVVNAVANGQFNIALPGPLTAQLVLPDLSMPQPPPPLPLEPPPPQTEASGANSPAPRAPEYELFDARTVSDVWREWRQGIAGRPALEGLEGTWGHLLRPTARQKTAWARRKAVLDELRWLVARGRTEEAAVAELEALRGSGSLRKLIDVLKSRQRARRAGGK
jgi:hypothetical protein